MNKLSVFTSLLILGTFGLSSSFVNATNIDESANPFIIQTHKLTGITLIPKKIIGDIDGYEIPYFETEPHRNHFDDRKGVDNSNVSSLVQHYTHCNYANTLKLFTENKPADRVSAHFVITQAEPEFEIPGGKIVQVVPLHKRAWHAGVSKWRDVENLNHTSIGIEHVNTGFTDIAGQPRRWYPFDIDQINSSGLLSQALTVKYFLPGRNVIGHESIAPGRKFDPGILFPWQTLHDNYQVGAWLTKDELDQNYIERYVPNQPLCPGVSIGFLSQQLRRYGCNVPETDYATPEFSSTLIAFKAHFTQNQNPEGYHDKANEKDMYWAWALNAKYDEKWEIQ